MIVEFVAGPYDGKRLEMTVGAREWHVAMPSHCSVMPPGDETAELLNYRPRIGLYVAEPYSFTKDKATDLIRITREAHTMILSGEYCVNGGLDYYWREYPIQFHWQGEP